MAVNGRLGGRVSYLANSGLTQRRLHAVFDLATPIVPIFPVPEDYQVDSARRHVLFVQPVARHGWRAGFGDGPCLAAYPLFKSARAGAMRTSSFEIFAGPPTPFQTSPGCRRPITCARYREAAVVLAPSLVEETWGRIVSEAQVSGIPALVSDRGALPETVAAGGVLMAADAPLADWSAALARMWDDRACYDRLAAAARAAAMAQTRALETVLDQWEALFRAAEA